MDKGSKSWDDGGEGRHDMVLLSDVAFFGACRQSETKIAIVSIEHSRTCSLFQVLFKGKSMGRYRRSGF
jgi:hypothetical protein